MLNVEHVSCGYGGEPVVKDVSFRVEEGGRLCILGPNGCGKTTLLRAVMGILPCSGIVSVQGEPLSRMSARQRAKRIALMSQMSSAYFSYTVYETVMLGRYAHQNRGMFSGESEEDAHKVLECLRETGLLEQRDRLITELSGGQLQRVFLARIFAQDPQVILLDEPTNHLDLKYQVELMKSLKDWAHEGKRCVVGVLHDINLALSFADTVLLMNQGSVKAYGDVKNLDLSLLSQTYQMDVCGYMQESFARWQPGRNSRTIPQPNDMKGETYEI